MKQSLCILVPTDFQQAARRAFQYGLALGRLLGMPLQILHVIKAVPDSRGVPRDSRALNSVKTAALLELGRLTRSAREGGARAEPRLEFGVPDACILAAVNGMQPVVIVMGTEGRTGWDRLRLGSTAQKVIRHAACPVLAVHGGLAGDALRHPARVRLKRLLLATDFSACAEEALQAVAVVARLTQGRLCVVHVANTEDAAPAGLKRVNGVVRQLRAMGLEAEGVCPVGEPIETILTQAARWEADLIGVGTQGRRGLSRWLLGSVAEGMLRRAGCPVLVVKRAASLTRAGVSGGRREEIG